jgi:hypothetical protein
MHEGSTSARVAPERPVSLNGVTRCVLVAATLLSGAVGVNCFLPWYTDQSSGSTESRLGLTFVEGMVDLVLSLACFSLFLAALVRSDARARARLAMIGACLGFGLAIAPLELYARGAWMGVRSVYVIGLGYTGWSYGLYLALINGFVAAGLGGLGAGRVSLRRASVPTKLPSLRKAPRAPGSAP